jgi:hypothetical protein
MHSQQGWVAAVCSSMHDSSSGRAAAAGATEVSAETQGYEVHLLGPTYSSPACAGGYTTVAAAGKPLQQDPGASTVHWLLLLSQQALQLLRP